MGPLLYMVKNFVLVADVYNILAYINNNNNSLDKPNGVIVRIISIMSPLIFK